MSKQALHNSRGDVHPITDCLPARCGTTTQKMELVATSVIRAGGQCPCGRVIGRRCFNGRPLANCPEREQ